MYIYRERENDMRKAVMKAVLILNFQVPRKSLKITRPRSNSHSSGLATSSRVASAAHDLRIFAEGFPYPQNFSMKHVYDVH